MKSTWAIIASSGLFAVIGLLAAWGVAAYSPAGKPEAFGMLLIAFISLPLGGAVVGFVIGYIATPMRGRGLGESRLSEREAQPPG